MPLVKVKPGLHHAQYSAGDVFDAAPAEMESFGDKFILLEEDADELAVTGIEEEIINALADQIVDATPGARRLAQEHGISLTLSTIVGSGKDGRITKADVEAMLSGDPEPTWNGDDVEALQSSDPEPVLAGDAEALINGDTE